MLILSFKGFKTISAVPSTKMTWFDRNVIRTRWPKFNKDPLQHAGNLVMRIARGSIKRRTKLRGKPSIAGSPPYSRQPGSTPPFKQIFSVPFRFGYSVAVGMIGYGNPNPPPGLHEHGGAAQRNVFSSNSFTSNQRRKRSTRGFRTTYKRKLVKYPQRPFMWPALLRAKEVLPSMWSNSISHG